MLPAINLIGHVKKDVAVRDPTNRGAEGFDIAI
jgi:hypothetical protein